MEKPLSSPSKNFKSEFAKTFATQNRLFVNDLEEFNRNEMCKISSASPKILISQSARNISPFSDLNLYTSIGSDSDRNSPLIRRSGFRFISRSDFDKLSFTQKQCLTVPSNKLKANSQPSSLLNDYYINKNIPDNTTDMDVDVSALRHSSVSLENDLLRIREEVEDLVKNNKDCKSRISLLLREKTKLHEELVSKNNESRILNLQLAKAQLISKTYELILSKLVSFLEEASTFNCCCHDVMCTCKGRQKSSYCRTLSSELTQKSSLLLTEIRDLFHKKKLPADVHLISRPSLDRSACDTSEVWV